MKNAIKKYSLNFQIYSIYHLTHTVKNIIFLDLRKQFQLLKSEIEELIIF